MVEHLLAKRLYLSNAGKTNDSLASELQFFSGQSYHMLPCAHVMFHPGHNWRFQLIKDITTNQGQKQELDLFETVFLLLSF